MSLTIQAEKLRKSDSQGHFTAHQRSCGKVMFFGRVCLSVCSGEGGGVVVFLALPQESKQKK